MARLLLSNNQRTNQLMKKILHKAHQSVQNLGDLIQLVSSCSRSKSETIAAVADLLERGRIRFQSEGHKVRAHVC